MCGEGDAFAQIACLAGHNQRGGGVQQHGVAVGAGCGLEHSFQAPRR